MTGWLDSERSAWLKRHWYRFGIHELARRFNARFGTALAPGAIRNANRIHRWGRSYATYRVLTRAEFRWIEKHIRTAKRAEISDRFEKRFGWRPNRSDLNTLVSRYGWQGAQKLFHWKPGHTHNNGRRWPRTAARMRTFFQPGNVPSTSKPLFSERWTTSSGRPLLQIKIPEPDPYMGCRARWVRKAVWVWRQAHGDVPAGHCILQLDGDPGNCDPENLVCVPRGVKTRMNHGGAPRWAGKAAQPARIRLAQLKHAVAAAKEARS